MSEALKRRLYLSVPALLSGVAVLLASRMRPRLSPDSVTYLAAASQIRAGNGVIDITGDPLTVFPPVYPFLLAPGGTSLAWAAVVNALAAGVATASLGVLLRRRVGPRWAIGAAIAVAGAHGLIRVGATVWTETTCLAISLTAMAIATAPRVTTRRAALVGALCALAFLTRYAGAAAGVACGIALLTRGRTAAPHPAEPDPAELHPTEPHPTELHPTEVARPNRRRTLTAFVATGMVVALVWIARNLLVSGAPLGPRFEGGATDSPARLLRLATTAIGQLTVTSPIGGLTFERIGVFVSITLGALAVANLVRSRLVLQPSRGHLAIDRSFIAFGTASFLLPMIARRLTSNDVEARVMSPMVIAMIYAAVVCGRSLNTFVSRRDGSRTLAWIVPAAAIVLLGFWTSRGIDQVRNHHRLASTGDRQLFSPRLHDTVDRLPADAVLMSNNVWGTWWQHRRTPTYFAFTRPRPGNSHYPLTDERLVEVACGGNAYLVWFDSLLNAGDGPHERRPASFDVVRLELVESVPAAHAHPVTSNRFGYGDLYRVIPAEGVTCR